MRLLLVAFSATAFFCSVHAADPDPLADFCVADLSPNAPLMNGFACKPRSAVTAKDFVYTGFRNADITGTCPVPILIPAADSAIVGNETAITFNTLTSQSPGLLLSANQIFEPNITSAVIEKSFGVDAATVKKLKASYPGPP